MRSDFLHRWVLCGGAFWLAAGACSAADAVDAGAGRAGGGVQTAPSPYGAKDGAKEGRPFQSGLAPLPNPKVREPVDLVEEAIDKVSPLTEDDVRRLIREVSNRDRAGIENNTGIKPATPTTVVYQIDLSPSARTAPPVIAVVPGEGCAISFVDMRGRPWPLEAARNMSTNKEIGVKDFGVGMLSVGSDQKSSRANVLVRLKGLDVPVSFTVVTGQDKAHYWAQMVIPRYLDGAEANMGSVERGPDIGSSDLTAFLLKDPPATAKALTVQGIDALAWQTEDGRMVVRTTASLNSPAWFRRRASVDGTWVYEMPATPSILATVDGRFVFAEVSGFDIDLSVAGGATDK